MAIYFFSEEITYQLANELRTKEWLTGIIEAEGYALDNINYVFCSDTHLLEINQRYLNHDTFTDIITFDNAEEEKTIEADIFISIERVQENATVMDRPFQDELDRVMIHGILHLIGFGDKTREEKQLMREKEDACLSLR